VVTYTLNRQPVHRLRYDGASEAAKVSCEMFERLLELDTLKHDSAANLVRRLATLADLSPSAFRLVLRAGSGDTGSILASFEDQARDRGKTRQALHWEWQEDVRRIRMVFPRSRRCSSSCARPSSTGKMRCRPRTGCARRCARRRATSDRV